MKGKKLISIILGFVFLGIASFVIAVAEPIKCKATGVKDGYEEDDDTWNVYVNVEDCSSICQEGGSKVCKDYAIVVPD